MTVIAKYKFNSTLYADLVPEFNAEFTNYVVTDEATETDSEGNVIKTRVIEHDTLLPTLMRFGRVGVNGESTTDNRTDSLLEVLDMNTSELTSCSNMFRYNKNLTSINCEWNTSNVTNMFCMFSYCQLLTSLDVSNFNTSNVNNMYAMFYDCNILTSLDLSNFDTSNITSMSSMFQGCSSLTSLDVSNFNTSEVTNMWGMFYNCTNLTSLDLSNFDTSKVTNMQSIFNNTLLLKDIGMLYCSQSTINALSSNISTPSTNVWVEGGMIDDLTSYDNVTYKAYYWEKEVLLNSPLLEGDKIVKKDGKLYHYHKMNMVILDGSEDEEWMKYGNMYDDVIGFYLPLKLVNKDYIYISDAPIKQVNYDIAEGGVLSSNEELFTVTTKNIKIIINKSRLSTTDINGFKQWLQENPITVISELANPYYELISDTSDDLSLSLLSEDNIISNNSLIPTNMNIKNNGMSTVAMNTSTKYTVAFDKDTDSSVTIDLCGSTIDTTDNVVEITTPSELANDEITFIGDCEVSNVRILEGSVSGDTIPKESFEGLKSSFEDSKLPGEEDNLYGINDGMKVSIINLDNFIIVNNSETSIDILMFKDGVHIANKFIDTSIKRFYYKNTDFPNCDTILIRYGQESGKDRGKVVENLYVFEGDWTHLTEEDWDNLGKYKVEYKVIGKNKFPSNEKYEFEQNISKEYIIKNIYLRKGEHVILFNCGNLDNSVVRCYLYDYNNETVKREDGGDVHYNTSTIKIPYSGYYKLRIDRSSGNVPSTSGVVTNIQIEEGTTITEYEPYKSYTKTFYLNSPLLEGDTIEDINGVATHVKRYNKVVFDGSDDEGWRDIDSADWETNTHIAYITRNITDMAINKWYSNESKIISNIKVAPPNENTMTDSEEHISFENNGGNANKGVVIKTTKLNAPSLNDFKQWLSQNPTTVVYELASPIYEPISDESILCDSYVNGHLDVDSNIPIEKAQFSRTPNISTKYLYPNTPYVLQFESDNIGKLNLSLANCYTEVDIIKGVNKISLPLADIPHNYLVLNGIGFNASNIQVVATDRDNIGYFKGIQSSFEDKVIEDETNENNGKYEVKVTLEDENGVISNELIYLNSPLLKGDRIEMYNGKLCHYHKMDKVVFDGSEDENWEWYTANIGEGNVLNQYGVQLINHFHDTTYSAPTLYCDKFRSSVMTNRLRDCNIIFTHTRGCAVTLPLDSKIQGEPDFRQWLQANPTTVVYQLAEPYYEDITPIQNEFVITSIGESSFTIDSGAIPTDGEITYSVNVKLLNDLEESINNNTSSTDTDLSTILDDIINE